MSVWRRLLDTVRALWPFEGEYWVEPSNAITRLVLAGPVPLSHIGLDDIGPFAQPAPAPQGAAATDSKATLVRRAKWLRENREAFAFWDRDFEENGLPLAEFQQF